MITIELHVVCNQLFQIFALIGYALENRCQFLLPYHKKIHTLREEVKDQTYWNTLFSK